MGEKKGEKLYSKFTTKPAPRTGGTMIYFEHNPKQGFHIPPDESLLRMYRSDMRRYGAPVASTRVYLQRRGLLASEKRYSIYAGLTAIGITDYQSTQAKQKALIAKRVERTFRAFWPKKDARKFLKDQDSVKVPRIKDYRTAHPLDYKWIKTHCGMFEYMEVRRPGLYSALAKTSTNGLDLVKLGNELRGASERGLPITCGYLKREEDPKRKKWYHQIEFVRQHNLLNHKPSPNRKLHAKNKYTKRFIPPFNEVAAKLSGISQKEIEGIATGRKQCGRLAQKFAEFYLLWAVRSGYDPLNLNLPGIEQIYFNTDVTTYHYDYQGDVKKGWTDGRLGNRPIEVKTGTTPFVGATLEIFLAKYANPKNEWTDGQPMLPGIAFFHQDTKHVREARRKIEEAGLTFVDYKSFHSALQSLFQHLERKYTSVLEMSEPAVNVPALLDAHTSLALEDRLFAFSHPGFETHRLWIRKMLDSLIGGAEQ